jgi:hypothetical protein
VSACAVSNARPMASDGAAWFSKKSLVKVGTPGFGLAFSA